MKLFNIALFGMICSTALSSSASEEYQEPTINVWCDSQDAIIVFTSSYYDANVLRIAEYCNKEWFEANRSDKPSNKQ